MGYSRADGQRQINRERAPFGPRRQHDHFCFIRPHPVWQMAVLAHPSARKIDARILRSCRVVFTAAVAQMWTWLARVDRLVEYTNSHPSFTASGTRLAGARHRRVQSDWLRVHRSGKKLRNRDCCGAQKSKTRDRNLRKKLH